MPGFVFSEYDTPESNSVLPNKNSKGSSIFGPTAAQVAAGMSAPVVINAAGTGLLGANGSALAAMPGTFTTLAASSTVSGAGFTTYFAAPPSIGTTTPGIVKTSNLQATYTDSSGTPGSVTNNSPRGRAAFAAAGTSVVVTNSLVAATSTVLVQLGGADATLTSVRVTAAAGSFTVTGNAAATGITPFDFLVIN